VERYGSPIVVAPRATFTIKGERLSVVRSRSLLIAGVCLSLFAGVTFAGTSSATTPPSSEVEILPPDEPYAGLTRAEWDVRWWQWAVSMPEDVNPNFDTTGERCGYGQSGPVFFVPAQFGEPSSDVTCVVAEGTALYVTAAVVECSTVEPPPFFGRNEAELQACTSAIVDEAEGFLATVNGQEVPDAASYRTITPMFSLTFPENNIFGTEPGVANAVAETFSFIIAPPLPGEYVITLSVPFPEFSLEATATVIVQAPQVIEPAPPTTEPVTTESPPTTEGPLTTELPATTEPSTTESPPTTEVPPTTEPPSTT
jgi:hypothetical protein